MLDTLNSDWLAYAVAGVCALALAARRVPWLASLWPQQNADMDDVIEHYDELRIALMAGGEEQAAGLMESDIWPAVGRARKAVQDA